MFISLNSNKLYILVQLCQAVGTVPALIRGMKTKYKTHDFEIDRWTRIIKRQGNKGIERMKTYLCSLSLGRDFGEDVTDYFERKGLTEFRGWARHNYIEKPENRTD